MTDEDSESIGELSVTTKSDTQKSLSATQKTLSDIPKSLTKDEAADCLNCIGPTFRSIETAFSYSSCTYAYLAMTAVDRGLTQLDIIPSFPHVIFLDISSNSLKDESLVLLAEMKQLITLVVDNNFLESAAIPEFPQLQILSLKKNKITTCEVRQQPSLEFLELAENNIEQIEPLLWEAEKLPKLKELGLRRNGLTSSAGINFPNLVSLFLADNNITELEGLEVLTNLKFLHLRNNPLKKLDGFTRANRKLFYINIRGCKVKNLRELKKLAVLPRLERIVVKENPFPNKYYRVEVIAMLPRVQKIDKSLVENNERKKGKKLAKRLVVEEGDEKESEDLEEEEKSEED